MTFRAILLAAAAAAGLGLAPVAAQDAGNAPATEDAAPQQRTPGQAGPGMGMMQGQGRGMGMGPGMGQGQGTMPGCAMMHGQGGYGMGMMHGQGRGMGMMQGKGKGMGRHRAGGPTLKIESKGHGFDIEFECNAPMAQCLEAIDRVYEAAGEARKGRRGPDGDGRGKRDDS